MKQIFFSLAFATLSFFASAQSADEAAIQKTLKASGTAIDKRDFNAFAACFVNSPDLYYQIAPKDGTVEIIYAKGFDNMTKMVGGYMKSQPPADNPKHTSLDYKVRVNGNSAYVTQGEIDEDLGKKESSRMFFVLEKNSSGDWKIASLIGNYYSENKAVEVK